MRTFKLSGGASAKGVSSSNDENNNRMSSRIIKNKSVSHTHSSSTDKREVLGELKPENSIQQSSSTAKKSSINKSLAPLTSNTSKIQIYKQQQQQLQSQLIQNQQSQRYQFKKPRIDNILKHGASSISTSTSDELDEEDEVDEYDFDDENKENIQVRKNNQFHQNSDDVVNDHFERILQEGEYRAVESLDPATRARFENWVNEEQARVSSEATDKDLMLPEDGLESQEAEDFDNQPLAAEPVANTRHSSEDGHVAMEPIWTRNVAEELHYVIQKYSRSTLDENDEDTFDVTMVAEYAPEIFNYMRELENKLVPDPNYMDNQDELKWEMRSVLIDWVVQVHSRFNLLPETLYLTVNYIDRFLSKRKVSLSRFQLVGAVALFIAAKYEEINCPTVQEVAYMADNAYSIDDFLKAERFMIDVLEFDMGWPGPMSFLRRTSKADDYDYETRTLAKYFLEITIMDSKFVASLPSWLAAGAHYLSRKLLNRGGWTELHVFYSGYTESQLRPLAEVLLQNCRDAETNHRAIFEKYQERRYRRSSSFVQEYLETVEQ